MTRPLAPRLRGRFQRSQTLGPVLLALAVGLLAGAGAIGLRYVIAGAEWLFFQQLPRLGDLVRLPSSLGGWSVLVAPAIGITLASWIASRWASEAGGTGVPEVQYSVRILGGRIRPRVILVKAITSALSIGSGASAGREGPIVHIGSALGSNVARAMGLGAEQMKLLLACGAAGALGATFNAPIAGVMFALEVVLGSFAARSFGLVVISSVTATALSQAVLGNEPAFRLLQPFTLVSPGEFGLYLILGVFLGLMATVYIRSFFWCYDAFRHSAMSRTGKAVLGGLTVGLIGVFGSELVLGSGHLGVERALQGDLAMGLMMGLAVLKIMATSISLGAGASGGVFAPALFVGAMSGGAFGSFVHNLFPGWTATSGAYALVGMAAVYGAAAHAPITAILVLFEMTDNYQIILPLMLSVVVAYLITSRTLDESIYTGKLRRLGGMTETSPVSTLDIVLVADSMTEEHESVPPDLAVEELLQRARKRRLRSWPVVDEEGVLLGIVTETDLERRLLTPEGAERLSELTVRDVMTTAVISCRPEESLRRAFRRFAEMDVQQIPVVEDDEGHLIGVLRRHEMLWAYRELADEHQRLLDKTATRVQEPGEETVQMELIVPPGDRTVCRRPLRSVRVPEHVLIALVRRASRTFVPRGDTRLEEGDVLVLLSTRRYESEMRAWGARIGGVQGGV